MGEVIQFPTPDETSGQLFTVCDDFLEEEVCNVVTLPAARNIARILSSEWPDRDFTVVNAQSRELFRVNQELETEALE